MKTPKRKTTDCFSDPEVTISNDRQKIKIKAVTPDPLTPPSFPVSPTIHSIPDERYGRFLKLSEPSVPLSWDNDLETLWIGNDDDSYLPPVEGVGSGSVYSEDMR